MRFLGFALFATIAVVVVVADDDKVELYSDKYDYIDADEILTNDRLRDEYYKCFMDTAPCITPDAKFFKGNFQDVLATKCKRCTEKQKSNFNKMADWYTQNRPDEWKAFVEKFVNDAQKAAE